MRSTPFVVALAVWAGLGLASMVGAQSVTGPAIHNVTLHEGAGLLTISGTGLRADMLVTVDGQPVAVLPGGTERQIEVLAPTALMTTPGTYRLTVVDPLRQVGDAFVVATQAARDGVARAAIELPSTGVPVTRVTSARGVSDGAIQRSATGAVAPTVIENSCNTAVGVGAFASNMTGCDNVAIGLEALKFNFGGSYNTAIGSGALFLNTYGYFNTAGGYHALSHNTSGFSNTATGDYALNLNTTGRVNTAIGDGALSNNTTGEFNTALGGGAGGDVTTGHYNLLLGSGVYGTASDTNTIRIGLPYDETSVPPSGQNQTFIAGIRGTAVSGGLPVVVDAAGKMGTADATALSVQDATNTQRYQLRLGYLNGVADYGIGRNPSDGVLDFTATQATYSGFRFNTPNAGTALSIANNGTVSMMDASNSRPYQLRVGHINGVYDYGIGRSPVDGYLNFAATQATYSGYRFNTPNAGTAVTIANNGAVGIGVTAPSQPLQLASGAYVSAGGVWTNASSRALKEDIAPLSTAAAIQAVADLSPVTFVYKAAPGEAHVGFIAEDVPALVATQDRRSLATMDLLAVVTKVVQVQQQQLHEQEAINADLRTRLATLEALLARDRER